ncbi:MAG: SBBP repeat-containing protein [Thermoplasmata archaeon]|nr:SBBP repeat-containing protein [Thermoplasmata archaeon]
MNKIVIIMICLFLLCSAVNLGTSKPVQYNGSTSETDYSIDNSVIDNAREQQILQNINRLDGYFTENCGQVGNDSVRYYIQGKGVWFLDDGVVFEIKESMESRSLGVGSRESEDPFFNGYQEHEPSSSKKRVVLKLNFEGCNKIAPVGQELLPHRSNFFYGNDPSKWCTKVPNYQTLIYENLYDDIDLRYYFANNGMKYDFIVHPGGNPDNIRMNYEGADELFTNSLGDIVIRNSIGDLTDSQLYFYQTDNDHETEINGRFKLIDSSTYGFEILGDYDCNRPLTIDPLIYSTYVGGNDVDMGEGIVIDSSYNAYVTGFAESSNFPNTTGANDTTHNDFYDVFVLKLDPTGSTLLFSTFVGGSWSEEGLDIEIDSSNNIYVTGWSGSLNFPCTAGAINNSYQGTGSDAIFLKLDPMGSSLLYSTYIGGSSGDRGYGIELDDNNDVYITGETWSSDFPTTPFGYEDVHKGMRDIFVMKLDPAGNGINDILNSTLIGGTKNDWGQNLVINSTNVVYVVGYTSCFNFPTTANSYQPNYGDSVDGIDIVMFRLNLTINGTGALEYSTYLGGEAQDYGHNIALDNNGGVYIVGSTWGTGFPNTTGAYDQFYNGGNTDAIAVKFDPAGNGQSDLAFSTYLGGTNWDIAQCVETDDNGDIYISGGTSSDNFPNTTGAFDNIHNGNFDIFLLKLDTTGSTLLYSTYIGGSEREGGNGMVLSDIGEVFITGNTESPNLPNTTTANDTTHNGNDDVFVMRFALIPNAPPIALGLEVAKPIINRTQSVFLFVNATDPEDAEYNLTPHFEYRDPNEQSWNNTNFTNLHYNNTRWEVTFTPLKNATLGLYDFRVRLNDTLKLLSNFVYLNDSLTARNNFPQIEDLTLSNYSALRGDILYVWINASDIEESENNITHELEYRDAAELAWETKYLSTPTYINNRWEYTFSLPQDAPTGFYDLRARCNDSDRDFCTWLYFNDTLRVYDTKPNVINMLISENSIYRTEAVYLYVDGVDYETPEDMLTFPAQYKADSGGGWTDLTGEYLNSSWEACFNTEKESMLGFYDFRASFEDDSSISSGWAYLNDSLEVLNNLPSISIDLDDINVGIQPLLLDLAQYESDVEDDNNSLTWSIDETASYVYIESATITDLSSDTLEIVPVEDVAGSEDIELSLKDKDGGIATKYDITIIVDSRITALTPKVTLKTPINNDIVTTLTPTLEWELDYSGTELITYTIILDENPEPVTPIKSSHTTTSYTLEKVLEDGKTYYWKVIPLNGICISEPFKFTVNLQFQPYYEVNITANKNYIAIEQGATGNIILTVENRGNLEEEYLLEFRSGSFLTSDIQITVTNFIIDPGLDITIGVTINVPDNMGISIHPIEFIVKSYNSIDETIVNVEVLEKGSGVPTWDVSINISAPSVGIKQGQSASIILTIINEGNMPDNYTIYPESYDFTSTDLIFTADSLSLEPSTDGQITVTITVPENLPPGQYTIRFIVESASTSDEIDLNVNVEERAKPTKSDDDEDDTMLYAGIGIIVIIIIIVLILLFLFVLKKKPQEEEGIEKTPPGAPEQPPPPAIPAVQPPQEVQPPEVMPQVLQVEEQPPEPPPLPQAEEQLQPQLMPAPQVEQPQEPEVEPPTVEEQAQEPETPKPEPQVQEAPVPKIKTQLIVEEK